MGVDRLSSLPEDILTDILSRLTIRKAASTSILSRRWRYLWTAVTRFRFYCDRSKYSDRRNYIITSCLIVNIIRQLTSPKLNSFDIDVASTFWSCFHIVDSWFHELDSRKVEHIHINRAGSCEASEQIFRAPASLFKIQSLVTLKFSNCLVQLPGYAIVRFPNLKNLQLCGVRNIPSWLGYLFRFSPRLEHLNLGFRLTEPRLDFQIFAPNLKSLVINMMSPTQNPLPKISIDAPRLTSVTINDSTSCYDFVRKPTQSIKAVIDLDRQHYKGHAGQLVVQDFMKRMSNFFEVIMSHVSELALNLTPQSQNNKYFNLNSNRIFPNVATLRIMLLHVGVLGWKDLLLSLHCFPKLNHLKVHMANMGGQPLAAKFNVWCAPDSIPECLITNLKTIKITMSIKMITDELKVLAYILSNAIVLEKLCIAVHLNEDRVTSAEQIRNFCQSLFELPRGSLTCEIVFSNMYITASSNDRFYVNC